MKTYDVAVIGAGSFGAWTAWHLRQRGLSVALVDAWGPANSRASSGGESRIIRMGYGADTIYTRMSLRSLAMWQQLFERARQPLFLRTGVLWMARRDHPYSLATEATLRRENVRFEILSAAHLAERYPQMHVAGSDVYGILEPDSGALMARRAVACVVDDAVRAGVDYAVQRIDPLAPNLHAETLVYACGPWLPSLFPELLGRRIYPTRQEVFFFGTPPGDRRFQAPAMPAWIDFEDPSGPYGFPDLEHRGMKLAFDFHGPAFDPSSGDRNVSDSGIAAARKFVGERFPALREAPLVESRVCQYENSSNGDFLIDRHPGNDRIWFAGGGSGHGFKHGPAVGEYLAQRIVDNLPAEPRFSLQAKAESQERTVY